MPQLSELPITVIVGGQLSDTVQVRPLPPFSADACDFLADLSKYLLAMPEHREYPDLAAFAYWCRPAHLHKLAQRQSQDIHRLGRGLVLHVVPANVPVNFAFSLAFGLLAGNGNIVRLPQKNYPQTEILCQAVAQLLAKAGRERLAAMNWIVRYPRDDKISHRLSTLCHARVLWGGDETITHFRQMPMPARNVEVAFADRYSLCLLDAVSVCDASPQELEKLVSGFYNDVYSLDQLACSSPHLVIWHGVPEVSRMAMKRFWSALVNLVQEKYDLQPIYAIDKYVRLCSLAIGVPSASHAICHGNHVYRIELTHLPKDINFLRGHFGTFFEYTTTNIDELHPVINDKFQTLTCYGVDRVEIARWIVTNGLSGIDRVVPVGSALSIGTIWDGYDIIGTLSRIVSLS